MTRSVPSSRNQGWGFWGTIRSHADPETAWRLASEAILAATGCPPAAVRDFLDSRSGRHFADEVVDGLAAGRPLETALAAAIERWMQWTIGRRLSRETGIPRGLPYLTGFVAHCEIEAEA